MWTEWSQKLWAWLDAQGFDLALRLTLLDLLLAPVGRWNVRPLVLLIAAAGLLHGGILRSPWTWVLLTLLTGWRVIADWPLADNHGYLLAYWCLAIALALFVRDVGPGLARGARLLIGFAFAFAVLWKAILSPDFTDERFFRVLLVTDDRFEELAQSVGGMTDEALEQMRELLERNRHQDKPIAPASLETPQLRGLASVLTWATLGLELAVALLFLLPPRLAGRFRDAALILFCAGTYAIAPVPGFGWLLLAMGMAQCPPEARRTRALYLACFAVVVLHDHVAWIEFLPGAS